MNHMVHHSLEAPTNTHYGYNGICHTVASTPYIPSIYEYLKHKKVLRFPVLHSDLNLSRLTRTPNTVWRAASFHFLTSEQPQPLQQP